MSVIKNTDMKDIVTWLNEFMVEKTGMPEVWANMLDEALSIAIIIGAGVGTNALCQGLFKWISEHNKRIRRSKWHPFIARHRLGHHAVMMIPGLVVYGLLSIAFKGESELRHLLVRLDVVYILVIAIRTCNSLLLAFQVIFSSSEKSRNHPLKGLTQGLQVLIFFIGGIVIIAVLINRSPAVLLTGLGASAAVLMLIFKDSILGFVAGVQLSQNNMIRLGDWIQMPDGSANGTVEEITLNTVKVRNWDNTLTMIPPYTLTNTPFKNWRGMLESEGRRADKCIYIDVNSLETCSEDMIAGFGKTFPMLKNYLDDYSGAQVTNIQIYRAYIAAYLQKHPDVNPDLDIIITQKEATAYGLPVEVYFFIRDKAWASFERKQSDIFSHLMTMAPEFGLHLYQRP